MSESERQWLGESMLKANGKYGAYENGYSAALRDRSRNSIRVSYLRMGITGPDTEFQQGYGKVGELRPAAQQ